MKWGSIMAMAAHGAAGDGGAQRETALFTLVDAIEQLSSARTVEDVAAVVRSAARRIAGADGVTFVLRDRDQCFYLDEDAVSPLWKGRRFPLKSCISGWAMLNRMTAVIPDIYADARIPHDAYRPTFVRSLVMTPVRAEDPLAAIGAYWAEVRTPTADEIQRLEAMARATATALANVQLVNTLEESLKQREQMVRELDHRVKNTLASVQSIARQTFRSSPTTEAFVEAFDGRLQSLSRAHELLTRGRWGPADLQEVLGQALGRGDRANADQVRAVGPQVKLRPETALSFLMTFHELATNARRHGALSREQGVVEVEWNIDRRARPAALEVNWRERGGPPILDPGRRGFGARLVEHALPAALGGTAQLELKPEGLSYRLRAPLSERISA